MLAYQCDICKTFKTGRPEGILYDNSRPDPKISGKGMRFDICPECLSKIKPEEKPE